MFVLPRFPFACIGICGLPLLLNAATAPLAAPDLLFAEQNGIVAVEAEHFVAQELTETRAFHLVTTVSEPGVRPDPDPSHAATASGHAYVEILPDTRATPDDRLITGVNVSAQPGQHAVLSYHVLFKQSGRYYFWARTYSTGSEDNRVHVGIDGTWPSSGQNWQSVRKHGWHWDCRQRTNEVRAGESYQLYLEVPNAGEHIIQISMAEDGFEIDKWVLARGVVFTPEDEGPAPVVARGTLPPPFPAATARSAAILAEAGSALPFPAHWGNPPEIQTRDLRPLPAGFGQGSSTLARWIEQKIDYDQTRAAAGTILSAAAVDLTGSGFYLDADQHAAINPSVNATANFKTTVPVRSGRYHLTLQTVGEHTGQATYEVLIGGRSLGDYQAPLSIDPLDDGPAFTQVWENVELNDGEALELRATIASNDNTTFCRARWSRLIFTPANFDPNRPPPAPFGLGPSTATYTRLGDNAAGASGNVLARLPDGDGHITVHGELKQWHKVTLDLDGPFAHEDDLAPNPFTDYAFNVTFTHSSGNPSYTVPGYFAADGNAAETGANAGNVWRVHFAPDRAGQWTYLTSFVRGPHAATYRGGDPLAPCDGLTGSFIVAPTDKAAPDFRARGRLDYTGERYLRFAGDHTVFLKAGADAPETFLAYSGFDNTLAGRANVPLKSWTPHIRDWRAGDPVWRDARGKGIIGALNYLASKGVNAFSFLTYNAGGDGDNVWPFVDRDDKLHYDVSKLDQWEIVFAHAESLGLHLHFKLQETEIDDHRIGPNRTPQRIPEAMDAGETGPERRLYLRELVARFGHHLALNWNLGEENTQSTEEQLDMLNYLAAIDAYQHPRVLHTFPQEQDRVYTPLLGDRSRLTGVSLQNDWSTVHERTLHWLQLSQAAGRPWVVANDEQGPPDYGVPPDAGYAGFSGQATPAEGPPYDAADIRKSTLWGNLMAGGAGVEYYFGYAAPQNDLVCEDYRSRDHSWDACRIALTFFRQLPIDLNRLTSADALVAPTGNWCLAAPDQLYVVYLPHGGAATLDLSADHGTYTVTWFNPRTGMVSPSTLATLAGGAVVNLGQPPDSPTDDWVVTLQAAARLTEVPQPDQS